jgi:hypothetical protein
LPTLTVALTEAVARAGDRTAGLLWRPFDARTWFVIAFAQFLAALPPDFWSGGGNIGDGGLSRAGDEIESTWEQILAGGVFIAIAAFVLLVVLVLAVVLLWVASRGKFIFLDDVLHRRAQIVKPWNEFAREGNSLFLCTISLFLIAFAMIAVAAVSVFATLRIGALEDSGSPGTIALLVAVGVLTAIVGVGFAYIAFYLNAFVVPLMHRYRIGAMEAWRRFYGIWSGSPFAFLLVGIVVIAGFIVFMASAMFFGFMTCCLGFLLLLAPYLSNVLLLPVTVFYRCFTVEFLAQYEPDLLPSAPMTATLREA